MYAPPAAGGVLMNLAHWDRQGSLCLQVIDKLKRRKASG